jgi:hypothetical protein
LWRNKTRCMNRSCFFSSMVRIVCQSGLLTPSAHPSNNHRVDVNVCTLKAGRGKSQGQIGKRHQSQRFLIWKFIVCDPPAWLCKAVLMQMLFNRGPHIFAHTHLTWLESGFLKQSV